MSVEAEFKLAQGNDGIDKASISLSHLKEMAPIDIEFNDLTYTVHSGKEGTIIRIKE